MNKTFRNLLWPYGPTAVALGFIVSLPVIDIWRSINAAEVAAAPPETVGAKYPVPTESLPQPHGPSETVSYTVFHTVPDGLLRFTTGHNYETPGKPPYRQYCYASHFLDELIGNVKSVRLAEKEGNEAVAFTTIGAATAASIRTTAAVLHDAARSKCRFIGGESLPKKDDGPPGVPRPAMKKDLREATLTLDRKGTP